MVTQKDEITLPDLSDEDKELALSHDGKLFALDLLNPDKLGYFSWFKGMGLALQNVGENKVRCICMYDDPPVYKNLALINESLKSVGGLLEYGDFTVRKQWIPEEFEEKITPEPSGMEVA